METRPVGATGVSVSQLCLGAMMFGRLGNPDHAQCARIVHRALDAGITFVDTADGYSAGESEEIIGQALSGARRDDVVIATKFGVSLDGNPNRGGGSRRWILHAVEGSLRRLRTDWIDFDELGAPDPLTDLDETLGALTDLVTAGKIRAFGTSKMPPSTLVEAHNVAERRGHGFFRIEESPYSMLTRAIEYDVLPTCRRLGMGVIAYSPLGGGWLSGRYRIGTDIPRPGSPARATSRRMDPSDPGNAAKLAASDALGALADRCGLTAVQLATAFTLDHPAITATIIGPRTEAQLDGYLAAADIRLADDVLNEIDRIVPAGATVDVADNMWDIGTTSLQPAERRRDRVAA